MEIIIEMFVNYGFENRILVNYRDTCELYWMVPISYKKLLSFL